MIIQKLKTFPLRFLLPFSIFLILGGFLWKGLWLKPTELPSVFIGKLSPSFNVQTVEQPEKTVTESIFKNKVSLLHVWATWCSTCQREHELLVKLSKKHHLHIIGLNYYDDLKSAQNWLKTNENPYHVTLFDSQGRLGMDYGVYGTPETFILDKDGIIQYRHVGSIDESLWNNELSPLLEKLESKKNK